jgi:hypothetical protein
VHGDLGCHSQLGFLPAGLVRISAGRDIDPRDAA